jgi:hypothetical protein
MYRASSMLASRSSTRWRTSVGTRIAGRIANVDLAVHAEQGGSGAGTRARPQGLVESPPRLHVCARDEPVEIHLPTPLALDEVGERLALLADGRPRVVVAADSLREDPERGERHDRLRIRRGEE